MSSAGLRSSQGELHQVPELDFSWYQPQDLCTTLCCTTQTTPDRLRTWALVRWEVCGGTQNWIQVSQPLNYSSSPPQQPHHSPATHTIVCLCSGRISTGLHAPENIYTGIWVLINPLELSWLNISVSLPITPSTQQNRTWDILLSAGDFWATPFYPLCEKL